MKASSDSDPRVKSVLWCIALSGIWITFFLSVWPSRACANWFYCREQHFCFVVLRYVLSRDCFSAREDWDLHSVKAKTTQPATTIAALTTIRDRICCETEVLRFIFAVQFWVVVLFYFLIRRRSRICRARVRCWHFTVRVCVLRNILWAVWFTSADWRSIRRFCCHWTHSVPVF